MKSLHSNQDFYWKSYL